MDIIDAIRESRKARKREAREAAGNATTPAKRLSSTCVDLCTVLCLLILAGKLLGATRARAEELGTTTPSPWLTLEVKATRAQKDQEGTGTTTRPEQEERPDVDSLPRGSIRKGRSVGINNKELEFDALDCSTPVNVSSTIINRNGDCIQEEETPRQRPVTVRVLQQAVKTHFSMLRCRARRYRMTYLCNWSTGHSTLVGNEWFFDQEWLVGKEECWTAWKEGRYFGQVVRPNTTNHVYHLTAGHDWSTGTDLHCEGAQWTDFLRQQNHLDERKTNVKGVSNMMVRDHINLELTTVDATMDQGGVVMDQHNQLILPCRAQDEVCRVANHATYIWTMPSPEARCSLYSTRDAPVKGVYLSGPDDRETFLSTDGSMLRLEVLETISLCEGLVSRTSYDSIYLTQNLNHQLFRRPLHESEVSLATYSNAKDEFLHREALHYINDFAKEVREESCRRSKRQRSADFARRAAEQSAILSGETAHLGGNRFVSAAGEAWYTYQCRPIVVRARQAEECYDSLPVTLAEEDLEVYLAARSSSTQERENGSKPLEFFMEPHSHRLTTVGIPGPCAPPFTPLFRNRHQRWIAAGGSKNRFYLAARPQQLEILAMEGSFEPMGTEVDYDGGGIYDAEAIRNMELFSQAPRAGHGLAANLATQSVAGASQGTPVHSGDLFPELRGVAKTLRDPMMTFLSTLWKWVDRYGQLCSIIVGTGILIKGCTWLAGVIMRLFTTPVVGNPLLHVVCAFFPSARALLQEPGKLCSACLGRLRNPDQEPSERPDLPSEEKRLEEMLKQHHELIDLYAERTVERMAAQFRQTGRYEEAAGVIRANLPGTRVYPNAGQAPEEAPLPAPARPPRQL